MGIKEANEHELFHPYPVLTEKSGEFVAQFKATVVVGKAGAQVLSGLPIDATLYKTEHKIADEAIVKLLAVRIERIFVNG